MKLYKKHYRLQKKLKKSRIYLKQTMANNNLHDNLLSVCALLDKHHIQYLVVGGAAVALHGYFRMSITSTGDYAEKPDVDIWYNPSYPNYFSLLNAIEELGQDIQEFKNEIAPDPKKSFFKLDFEKLTVDFLPELPGLNKFRDSYARKEIVEIEEQEIFFISIDDLITSKEALLRDKDITDIAELKKRRKNR